MKPRKPLKRSWIRRKPKRARVLWRSGRVILDAAGMRELRETVFARSGGRCENCRTKITWEWFELHHLIHRSRGGSDDERNCAAYCRTCHAAAHGNGPASDRP